MEHFRLITAQVQRFFTTSIIQTRTSLRLQLLKLRLTLKRQIHPSISLSSAEDSIVVEGATTLTVTTVPADAVVTWTSSDDEVATVANGVVTGIAEGTATITATITVDGTDYTDTCTITVTEE